MAEFTPEDVIAQIAVNTGNADKQLEALAVALDKVNAALKKAKAGTDAHGKAISDLNFLNRQQAALFRSFASEAQRAEKAEEGLIEDLRTAARAFGEQSKQAQIAKAAIAANRSEMERHAQSAAKAARSPTGDVAAPQGAGGVLKVFTELRQSLGQGLQSSVLGVTGNLGQLALAVGGVGLAAGGIGVAVGAVFQLGQQAIQAASKYEKLRAVLKTTFGSEGVARQVQQQLLEFSAQTPFTVEGITDSYIKLANRGLKPSNAELTNLGDFAAATGKDLGQLTEAILDVSNQERWNEFGIRVTANGNKISGTFKGVTKEFERSEAGAAQMIAAFGRLPGVAGGMAAQSATLEGQLSNLGDNLDQFYLAIGERMLPASKGFVGSLNEMISGLTSLVSEGYAGVVEVQGDVIRKNQSEIQTAEALFEEYNKLRESNSGLADEKEKMIAVTGQLVAILGQEVLELDKSGNAIGVNTVAYQNALRVRRLAANTEIAGLLESLDRLKQNEAAIGVQAGVASKALAKAEADFDAKFGKERRTESQVQNIASVQVESELFKSQVGDERSLSVSLDKELEKTKGDIAAVQAQLKDLRLSEADQAAALLDFKTGQLKTETGILESKRQSLKVEIQEQSELEARTRLDKESASAALIRNKNLQGAEEARIKGAQIGLKLDETRRKTAKELDEVTTNIGKAQALQNEVRAKMAKAALELEKESNEQKRLALQSYIAEGQAQMLALENEVAFNNTLKDRRELLLGTQVGKDANGLAQFQGGLLEQIARLEQQQAAKQRAEAFRAYQKELMEARRNIQKAILEVEQETNELLVEGSENRARKEFEVAKKLRALELEASLAAFKEENRDKGLRASELEAGLKAIRDKAGAEDLKAGKELEEKLYDIRKGFADKNRALAAEQIKAEAALLRTILEQPMGAADAGASVARIAALERTARRAGQEADEADLQRRIQLAQSDAGVRAALEAELAALRIRFVEEERQAELKALADVAQARAEAVRFEFAMRAQAREQGELGTEAEALAKEQAAVGNLFANRGRMERERNKQLRGEDLARAKERQELARAEFQEAEKTVLAELASRGQATRASLQKEQEAKTARLKADNEVAKTVLANSKAEQEDRRARAERAMDIAKQVGEVSLQGISQINAALNEQRDRELANAQSRLDIIYRDLELGRRVNEEVITREQERIAKIQADRKRAADAERAITLGQIVLQQILAVASAAANAAKTGWVTIPIAVASAILAVAAGARQARASVSGYNKGVIRLGGGRDERARDTELAMLTKGESVMTVAATNRAERALRHIQLGLLSDRDLFRDGKPIWRERSAGAGQALSVAGVEARLDRVVSAVEAMPGVKVQADGNQVNLFIIKRTKRAQALGRR
jgi:hypothetical protein